MGENDLYEVALLIDDLKNEDITARLNSIKNLQQIAQALGPGRARTELLPYLAESIDDEDEVLLEMAKSLGAKFVPFIGGNSHAVQIFLPLKALATCEDPSVRLAATASINEISEVISTEEMEQHFYKLSQELFEKDWFTSRFSCAHLLPVAYERIANGQLRAEMRDMFVELASDKRAQVRRAANKNLGKFCAKVEPAFVSSTFVDVFVNLASDDEDLVRAVAVENVVAFLGFAASPDEKELVVKATNALGKDKSWKIRWNMAENFQHIFDALQSDETAVKALVEIYIELLQDHEPEVQRVAAEKLPVVALRLEDEVVVNDLMPQIVELALSFEPRVRETLANVMTDLLPIFHSQNKLGDFLKPFLDLIGDQEPKVRLGVLKKLNTRIPGPDRNEDFIQKVAPTLLPAFYGLIDEHAWRIRNEAIKLIPLMADQLGVEKFTESLAETAVDNLSDEASENRAQATENIRKLYDMFGSEWVSNRIIPKVTRLSKDESYLIRIQSIRVVQSLASGKIESEFLSNSALPMLSELASDATANVKFNVAKCLGGLAGSFDGDVLTNEVQPILAQLMGDKDTDVAFFASQALEALDA